MPEVSPQVMLRLGSHSEKEYVEKTVHQFDGLIVGANLLEASPAATASLLLKLSNQSQCPYFVDPMTYAFGAYVDPKTSSVRTDLDWIKSDQKVKGGKKGQIKRDFKSSYCRLAERFGEPISTAVQRNSAVNAADFNTDQVVRKFCERVLDYQANRLRNVFKEDPEMADFILDLPVPAALFAPYFYIEKSNADSWIELNRRLALTSKNVRNDIPIHVIVCCHRDLLTDNALAQVVIQNLLTCKPAAVWLWFSRFDEHEASRQELASLRSWVEQLSPHMAVFNMHGGFFSLILSRLGMAGIAHGVGYGEQKDVVPVIGQSTPTVRYYVRSLHDKSSVVQVTRSFSALGIKDPDEFYSKICDCPICKGIIAKDLNGFAQFGEIHRSTPTAMRMSQTPAAAKRCRFHFLLNRLKERDYIKNRDLPAIVKDLESKATDWSATPLTADSMHLKIWASVLT